MAVRATRPISSPEFARMMQAVKPPSGWSETLAVANSGGPDSTCLLFLLNRYLKAQHDTPSARSLPQRLVSLTVDHDLQVTSTDMAEHAARIAETLGVSHVTTKLPWGQGSHPPKPGPDVKIEERARDMRYVVFMENMVNLNANSLALGHHCDDQVETMLMRLGRGSGQFGLAGMRPCRRWGMGVRQRADAGQNMIEEMRRWIVRPLLSVEKDRILATCEEHKLEYVTDPTNFQPQLTIRNAIRHVIKKGGAAASTPEDTQFADFPHPVARALADINIAATERPSNNFNLASDSKHLREVSKNMTSSLLDIDNTVDDFIANHRLPSPEGTFMTSPLSLTEIDSQITRQALLYRITRYVSPEPWGSPRSELGRRKASMNRLVRHLWGFEQYQSKGNNSLCVGSGVWWRLVEIRRNQMRTTVHATKVKDLAWLASRQPGHRLEEDAKEGPHPLKLNITADIQKRMKDWITGSASPVLEMLYDCRFLIRFRLDEMPSDIKESLSAGDKLHIKPRGIWNLPQIIHGGKREPLPIHTVITPTPFSLEREWGTKKPKDIKSDWIDIEYFRPISAI